MGLQQHTAKAMNKVSLEEVNKGEHILRVKDLRRAIDGLSDDTPVLIERVEDVYFDGRDISGFHGILEDGTTGPLPEGTRSKDQWPVVLRDSDITRSMLEHNEKVRSGYFADRENFPTPHPCHVQIFEEHEFDEFRDQFSPAQCCVVDDAMKALYIRLHY